MKLFTIALALITTGAYASTSSGLATEDNDLRSLVEALTVQGKALATKVDEQSNKIAYLENKMIQGKKKKLRGLREDEVDQNLEEQFYFSKVKELGDALTTLQACLQFDSADGGTCTIGEDAAFVTVFADDIHPNGDGPINVSGSGLSATTLKATGIVDDGGLVSASSTPALVLSGDLQVNGAIHSSGAIESESFITALFGNNTNSVELTDEAAIREADDTTEEQARIDADAGLQDNIDDEAETRSDADFTLLGNIGDEATTRGNADTGLQDNIVDEAETRGDADFTLQENIDAEATTRGNADTGLQANTNQVTNFLQGAPNTTLV